MNRTKQRRNSKPNRGMPTPTGKELIVLAGLVQTDAGKSLGLEVAFCTADQTGGAFFLGPKDMVKPWSVRDRDEALAAWCPACRATEAGAQTHWIVDLRTAALQGVLQTTDTDGGGFCVEAVDLLRNLAAHEGGSAASRAAVGIWRAQQATS